ncbi:MAG: DUF853 domain-containing protein [Clostridia bacterium]|nr:DUF853 domain-containing protein [Clostridia bacterium]
MFIYDKSWIGLSETRRVFLLPKMANRHGIISGASGTGKTTTLKVLSEAFSDAGVPVFFADVKGDLSGMIMPGEDSEKMRQRIDGFGIENWTYKSFPVRFWDIFGEKGTPVRMTVTDMGPQLLSRLLELNDVQAGVLTIIFKVADQQGLELIDFKDLKAMVQYVGDNRKEFSNEYGLISPASVGAIQRALLNFSEEGAEHVFGEADLDIYDWIKTDSDGRGYMNILASDRLINSPKVYATFLLWMLTELFEKLPEVGDPEKPKIVFFFDEAHLLFTDAPKTLVRKIVQVVKLIRSKGVGVYFVTQSPSDIPDEVLAQLSNRIQHGLRAYTPAEQKSIRAAAWSFRANPAFNTEEAIMNLGVGEAVVSFLDSKGAPEMAEKVRILPPQSFMGAAPWDDVEDHFRNDEMEKKYRESVDRESAYEIIMEARAELQRQEEEAAAAAEEERKQAEEAKKQADESKKKTATKKTGTSTKKNSEAMSNVQKVLGKSTKTAVSSATSTVSRGISSGIVNAITGSKNTFSAQKIAKNAATNALSGAMRTGLNEIIRGFFGNKK